MAMVGMAGVGKTAVLRAISGESLPDGTSRDRESGRIQGIAEKIKLVTVPGQIGQEHERLLDEEFEDPPIGVVYFTSFGYSTIRSEVSRAELQQAYPTIDRIRDIHMRSELAVLREVSARIAKSLRRGSIKWSKRMPRFLLVVPTKIDLYYDRIMDARDYYSVEGNGPFAEHLRSLQRRVGEQNLRIESLPVSAGDDPFDWARTPRSPRNSSSVTGSSSSTSSCRPSRSFVVQSMESRKDSDDVGTTASPPSADVGPGLEVVEPLGREIDIDELDRLLDLAREIQARIDRLSRRGLSLVLVLGFYVAGSLLLFRATGYSGLWGLITLPVLLACSFAILASLLVVNRRMTQEMRGLQEVLVIAREVEQVLATSDQIRPLTRARIRMRLSHFNLSSPLKSSMPAIVRVLLRGSL